MAKIFPELVAVLESFSQHNLCVNPGKCQFGQKEECFWGHYVSKDDHQRYRFPIAR